jgi:murein L,D-transpeptidase YcbB/YkuD
MTSQILLALTVAQALTLASSSALAQGISDLVQEGIRSRIEASVGSAEFVVAGERIYALQAMPAFYERRTYWPAWSDDSGPLPQARALLRAIRAADREGLRPADYHLAAIEALLARLGGRRDIGPRSATLRVYLDLLLTDAFLIYGSHLLAGRVDPVTIDAMWIANRREANMIAVLEDAVASNCVEESLRDLLPSHPEYLRLRDALARHRTQADQGGWPQVPDGPRLAPGDRGPRVLALRQRLAAFGDLDPAQATAADSFDTTLEAALRGFQRRHGLKVNGTVGPATLAALNITAAERARQIELNLERWRWLPQTLGQRYVIVNIANFELDVVEGGRTVLTMRAVVGRPYRRTPVFSDSLTYLVFSPYWQVPRNLAVEDLLPQIKSESTYLSRQQIKVFVQGADGLPREVDPKTIDWSRVTAQNYEFRLRQEPGPANALGRVKFMFPNRFNVYLHDTPARDLFGKTSRDFSSGCIRLEKPIELAEYVLRDDPAWPRHKILGAANGRVEQTVRLPRPIPIHLLYWTAWVAEDGSIQFRNDVYGRDPLLDQALQAAPPGS